MAATGVLAHRAVVAERRQLVWVDRGRRVVVAKLSHWPYPQDLGMLLDTLRAIEALTEALS